MSQVLNAAGQLLDQLAAAAPTPTPGPTGGGGGGGGGGTGPGTDELFKGLKPDWGPFAEVGSTARTVIQVIMAAVVTVCLGVAILGAGKIRFGKAAFSHDPIAVEDGRKLVIGGLVGVFIVASMGTLFTIVYGMGI